jgi:hypothetical protein
VKPSFGALSVQPLDEGEAAATTVPRRQGEVAVDAAFDVEGGTAVPGLWLEKRADLQAVSEL